MKKLLLAPWIFGLTGMLTIGSFQVGVAEARFKKNFTVDVACNGSTLGLNPADPADPPFSRGDMAVVTGTIYPADTLPSGATTFDPTTPGGIGAWRCLFASLAEPPIIGAITYYRDPN